MNFPKANCCHALAFAITSLLLVVLPASIFIPLRAAAERGGQVKIVLTDAEQSWLKTHRTIRVGLDPVWAPVEFLDENGRPQGIYGGG